MDKRKTALTKLTDLDLDLDLFIYHRSYSMLHRGRKNTNYNELRAQKSGFQVKKFRSAVEVWCAVADSSVDLDPGIIVQTR